MSLQQLILKHVLHNAIKYKGKANPGAIVPKVIGEDPSLKTKIKEIMPEINKCVSDVNKMSVEEQTKKLMEIAPEMLEEKPKEDKEELKELDDVDLKKGVVMRFAPSPSGPMHIGHAITGGMTSLYTRKYNGKFLLRIEDTNSDNIDPTAYEMLPTDGKWIFGNVTEVWIQSDRMQVYYDYAVKFFNTGSIYVCTCSQEDFKKHSDNMEDCPCRKRTIQENLDLWKKMFDKNALKEGDCVVRFKAGMQNNNPAMRDFPLIRINDSPHPRQGTKYRVWPLMNFAVTVDDIEYGMTHIIRAKDHADNAKRQEMMYNVLGIKVPKTYFLGRYNFEGLEISCSKTKAKIKEGVYSGWDDIRVPFLVALKRRGYQPDSFLKYTRLTGLSPVDKTIPAEEFFKIINSFNKEIIEPKAYRFFMIRDPVKIDIKNTPHLKIELDLHPDNKKGGRHFSVNGKFMIEKTDYARFKDGELLRLMDCVNFSKKGEHFEFVSEDYEEFKDKGKIIIHWLPDDEKQLLPVEILMPDNTTIHAKAESTIKVLKEGDIIQFERFGFCRLDSIEKGTHKFWFTHK
jgi:glutamyl-tRNA synthetase